LEFVADAASKGTLSNGPLRKLWNDGRLDARGIYESAKAGDPTAQKAFARMGWALGLALADLFTVLGIRHAILGGGVSASWDQFIDPLRRSLAEYSSMLVVSDAVVQRSALGDDAALLGAARLAFRR
jgi:glucokinase